MNKAPDAFRTIGEVAHELDLPQHVLRFWESQFPHIKPVKRAGGRRYYRPEDIDLLRGIRRLLYGDGYTIKGVQRILREQGLRAVQAVGHGLDETGSGAETRSGARGAGARSRARSAKSGAASESVPEADDEDADEADDAEDEADEAAADAEADDDADDDTIDDDDDDIEDDDEDDDDIDDDDDDDDIEAEADTAEVAAKPAGTKPHRVVAVRRTQPAAAGVSLATMSRAARTTPASSGTGAAKRSAGKAPAAATVPQSAGPLAARDLDRLKQALASLEACRRLLDKAVEGG